LQSGDLTQDIALRDGDSLILETAPPLEISQAMALGNSNVAQKTVRVGLWGETQQTGTFEVPPNTPLNQVLLAAGGFNTRAQQKTVDLIRLHPNGTVSQATISLDLSASVSPQHNPIIQDRDIIRVHPTRLFRASDRVNQVIAPLTNTIGTVLQPVTSLFSVMNVFQLFSNFFGSGAK
jgi:polysaccharide biosynthesis/export protein